MSERCWIVVAMLIAWGADAHADKTLEYRTTVTDVVDGNTVVISNRAFVDGTRLPGNQAIPLDAIAAPALDQPGGEEAKRFLSDLLKGKSVRVVELLDMGNSRGAWVFIDDRCANLLLVQVGLAWVTTAHVVYMQPADGKALADAFAQAKAQKLGLWARELPIPPWEWRKRKEETKAANKEPKATP